MSPGSCWTAHAGRRSCGQPCSLSALRGWSGQRRVGRGAPCGWMVRGRAARGWMERLDFGYDPARLRPDPRKSGRDPGVRMHFDCRAAGVAAASAARDRRVHAGHAACCGGCGAGNRLFVGVGRVKRRAARGTRGAVPADGAAGVERVAPRNRTWGPISASSSPDCRKFGRRRGAPGGAYPGSIGIRCSVSQGCFGASGHRGTAWAGDRLPTPRSGTIMTAGTMVVLTPPVGVIRHGSAGTCHQVQAIRYTPSGTRHQIRSTG